MSDGPPPQASPGEAQAPQRRPIYREQALEHHRRALQQEGDVLHLSPRWMRSTYWVLLAFFGAGILLSIFGQVHQYASGPALVRMEGRTELTVAQAGVVVSVAARPGQAVEANQTLLVLQATEEQAELDRIRRELDLQLVRVMTNPAEPAARESLIALNAALDRARARVEARTLRAPFKGVLGDLRAQPGQFLAAGAHVATMERHDSPPYLLAFLPGQYRPLLHRGMPLRVELEGFRYEYLDLKLEWVGEQIVGPAELRRSLGPDLADAVPLAGPLVVVRANLSADSFTSGGRRLGFFDGMPARAQVPVQAESIWSLLIPGWKALRRHGG